MELADGRKAQQVHVMLKTSSGDSSDVVTGFVSSDASASQWTAERLPTTLHAQWAYDDVEHGNALSFDTFRRVLFNVIKTRLVDVGEENVVALAKSLDTDPRSTSHEDSRECNAGSP